MDTWFSFNIDASEKTIRLLAGLNPDATQPIQGEEFGEPWSLPIEAFAKKAKQTDFWTPFMDIDSACVCLRDNLSPQEAFHFITFGTKKVLIPHLCEAETLIDTVCSLSSGVYAIMIKGAKTK